LHFLGGKREQYDRDPEFTATREFCEEARLDLEAQLYYELRTSQHKNAIFYQKDGGYALFLWFVQDRELFERISNHKFPETQTKFVGLRWVPLNL
jgi:8-oxo-dGTP pyrophosphatase MutT (NUDIX family)